MKNLIKYILVFISVLISTTIGAEELVYAQVGEKVTLKCPSVSQDNYLSWKFGDLQLGWRNPFGGKDVIGDDIWKDRLSMSGDSLVISNIQQQHFGTFNCELQSKNHITYQLLRLDVTTNPQSPLLPGESLSLSCNAETRRGKRAPEIYLLNPQKEKMKDTLTVKATSQHDGQWTCVVKNVIKEHSATFSVTVLGLSSAPSHRLYTSKLSPLTIPCSIPSHISWEQFRARGLQEVYWQFSTGIISDSPERLFNLSLEESLTWKKDQPKGLRPVSDPKKGNLSLTRKQGKEEDRGDYVCIMKFKNGAILKSTVHVEVLNITASPRTDLISGQQLNLTCGLGHHLPSDLEVKWTPPGQSSYLFLKSDPHPSHFTIPAVCTGDSGKWGCALWQGDTQLTSDVITLKIEPRLSVWMLMTICSAAVILILILIVVFILYWRRHRKMRHLRHRFCQCKNPQPKGFYRT